jgi:hypothetical protein
MRFHTSATLLFGSGLTCHTFSIEDVRQHIETYLKRWYIYHAWCCHFFRWIGGVTASDPRNMQQKIKHQYGLMHRQKMQKMQKLSSPITHLSACWLRPTVSVDSDQEVIAIEFSTIPSLMQKNTSTRKQTSKNSVMQMKRSYIAGKWTGSHAMQFTSICQCNSLLYSAVYVSNI